MTRLPYFLRTIPNGKVLHELLKICCSRSIPFHYDPSDKHFTAYPVCDIDLDFLISSFEFACSGLFVPDSNT